MFRFLTISAFLHVLFLGLLIALQIVPMPRLHKKTKEVRLTARFTNAAEILDQAQEAPIATPVPELTPVPTPYPTPIGTPIEIEPEEIVKQTPPPTPKPTKTPKPEPTKTPKPKPATPKPTPEDTPKPTPEPTPEATPEPTPEATPVPTPAATPEATPVATPSITPPPLDTTRVTPPPMNTPSNTEPSNVVLKGPGAAGPASDLPGYYAETARMRIRQNFVAMQYQRQNRQCEVSFVVQRDGMITDIQVIESTGNPDLDRLAVAAMERTRQLARLPSYIKEPSIQLVVTFDFSMSE